LVFLASGVWGVAALTIVPVVLAFAAHNADHSVGLYVFLVGNVVVPFAIMTLAFRLRRPRTNNAHH
jgi:hypothetical protein